MVMVPTRVKHSVDVAEPSESGHGSPVVLSSYEHRLMTDASAWVWGAHLVELLAQVR